MQPFIDRHFLSRKDNLRFMLFVAASLILVILGSANHSEQVKILPNQNQLLDSQPKETKLFQEQKQVLVFQTLNKA